MKILLIGGGNISDRLAKTLDARSITRVRLRDLSSASASTMSDLAEKCSAADLIVYLAYHHTDTLLNLTLLRKLLRQLSQQAWQGCFAFLNTQAVLPDAFVTVTPGVAPALQCDLYTITKRLQSKTLNRYANALNICEIYLPVVIGKGTNWQIRLQQIAGHRQIKMPQAGAGMLALLDIDIFVRWFVAEFCESPPVRSAVVSKRRVFIYQETETLAGVLRGLRQLLTLEPVAIGDCNYRYRYSPSFRQNFVWWLKLSPLGCLAYFMLGIVRKRPQPMHRQTGSDENPKLIDTEFSPTGPEYQFFSRSIDTRRIRFRVERIG